MANSDQMTSISDLRAEVRQFIVARDWDQFHSPKDLAIGLITEAAELLELFRFRGEAEVSELLADGDFRRELRHEMADCFFFMLAMSHKLNVDLSQALAEKMALSAQRYPVELARGKNAKYTVYASQNQPPGE